jgi:Leucine-rich repeat (LRR) protein
VSAADLLVSSTHPPLTLLRRFQLASLSANTNEIADLPPSLKNHLPSLCSLSLYQNSISSIPPLCFADLPSLTSLDLGRNRLKDSVEVAAALNLAPTIRRLVLSQNQVGSRPRFYKGSESRGSCQGETPQLPLAL